ncbi:MAG: nicotinate-nicotinamide nucleotide adenylyltransferase [Oligoflexus sp.]|nr:nicotinate-nicotinamide nucleotide adenylyltransferase [Oligoflexus sp.]
MTASLVFKTKMTHVFFGGTFDPPHEGHRLVLKLCLAAFPEVKLVIAPAAQPAGAYGQHKQPSASFEQRLEMCRLTFADLIAKGRVRISPIEASMTAPNYTWKTMEALKASHPESCWGILLGFDQLQNFAGWQKAEELVDRYDVVAIERPSFETMSAILPKLIGSLGTVESLGSGVYRWGTRDKRLYVLTGEVSNAASRMVRASIDQADGNAWLDPKVMDYIRQQKLYDESEA